MSILFCIFVSRKETKPQVPEGHKENDKKANILADRCRHKHDHRRNETHHRRQCNNLGTANTQVLEESKGRTSPRDTSPGIRPRERNSNKEVPQDIIGGGGGQRPTQENGRPRPNHKPQGAKGGPTPRPLKTKKNSRRDKHNERRRGGGTGGDAARPPERKQR